MQKWRLPIVPCAIQTAVTGLLTLWADRVDWLLGDSNRIPPPPRKIHILVIQLRRVWRGVNAPTLPFNYAGHQRFHILGLSVPEIPYLLAVVALWFLVGYFREPAKQRKLNPSRTTGSSKTIPVGSMVWEVILLLFSLLQIREAFRGFRFWRTFNLTAALNVPLYAMGAVVLIRFGLQALETLNRQTSTSS